MTKGRVSEMMRNFTFVLVVAACGGKQQPPVEPTPPPVTDTRKPIEKRRDAACELLAPRITACAVEDAKKDLASGKITQKQFDQDTAAGVQKKNSEEFIKKCEVELSSRQVRVLEVCPKAESECDPMLECLQHLNGT